MLSDGSWNENRTKQNGCTRERGRWRKKKRIAGADMCKFGDAAKGHVEEEARKGKGQSKPGRRRAVGAGRQSLGKRAKCWSASALVQGSVRRRERETERARQNARNGGARGLSSSTEAKTKQKARGVVRRRWSSAVFGGTQRGVRAQSVRMRAEERERKGRSLAWRILRQSVRCGDASFSTRASGSMASGR